MSKHEKLLNFYTTLLTLLNVEIGEGDALSGQAGQPLMIENRRVFLPTRDVLKNLSDDIVGFHPLSENVFEGLSPVATLLRKLAMCRVSDIVLMSMYSLLKITVDKASHSKLSAGQMEIVSKLSGADEKLVESLEKLSEQLDVDTQRRIVNMALRHNSLDDDRKKTGRSCRVTFPLWDELQSSTDGTVFGVKFRKKDLPVLREAMKIVLPKIEKEGAYDAGSTSSMAPYFVSLMKALMGILADTNSITWKFRSLISEINNGQSLHVAGDELETLLSGIEDLKDIGAAVRPLPYNMGDKNDFNVKSSDRLIQDDVEDTASRLISDVVDRLSREPTRGEVRAREDNEPTYRRREPIGLHREDRYGSRSYSRRDSSSRGIGIRDGGDRYSSRYDRYEERSYRRERDRHYGSYREERYTRGSWRSAPRR